MSDFLEHARHHVAQADAEHDPDVANHHRAIALDNIIEAVSELEQDQPTGWLPYLCDCNNRLTLIIPIPLIGYSLVIPTPLEAH
jgi:hypothetical protein